MWVREDGQPFTTVAYLRNVNKNDRCNFCKRGSIKKIIINTQKSHYFMVCKIAVNRFENRL